MASIIRGSRQQGLGVRQTNTTGCAAVANKVRTTLGPNGLDKMLVTETGEMSITNDGASIVQQVEVTDPAGKVLVGLAKLQDNQIGDGTTSVVLIAADLMKNGLVMLKQGIHPTTVIGGYRSASREAIKFMREFLSVETSSLGRQAFVNIAKTSLSSKVLSNSGDHFPEIVVKALESVKTVNDVGDYVYPAKAISILKQHGKSMSESTLVNGFALNCIRASQAMPIGISDAKIALLDFDLWVYKLKLGCQIRIDDVNEIENIRKKEMDVTKDRVNRIIDAGANVILTTGGIDDTVMKTMVERKVMGIRRCKKDDLKRIAKATGGSVVTSMVSIDTGDEVFEVASLGKAQKVSEERFADDECTVITGGAKEAQASIILRGANTVLCDEMERALNDALQACKRAMETPSVVAGGGAVEIGLTIYLEKLARSTASREQAAILEFAKALTAIPRQLALNAALDASELIADLRVVHGMAQSHSTPPPPKSARFAGLNLKDGDVWDCMEEGVIEPAISKIKSIQSATEAAIALLRIDDIVTLEAKEDPGAPQ